MRIRGLFLSGYLIEVVQPATGDTSNVLTNASAGLMGRLETAIYPTNAFRAHVSDAQGLLKAE